MTGRRDLTRIMTRDDVRRWRGQSLTEFAVSITFIMILLAGAVDLGRAYFVLLALRDSAQEGASYAAIDPHDVTGIRQRVRESSGGITDFSDFTDSQIQIQVTGYACAGYSIEVRLTYDFQMVAPFFSGKVLPLKAVASDTILQPPC